MPFARPTLSSLRDLSLADVLASLLGVKGLLRFGPLMILSWMQAKLAHLQYGYLDWIALQSTPFTATDEYLESWAALVGVIRQAAVAATGLVLITGTAGTLIPAGTAFRRAVDGVGCVTTADATIGSGGTVTAPIVATVAGSNGDAPDQTPMLLVTPILNILQQAQASGVIASGADQETDDSLRTRMLIRYANTPQGGSASDHQEWTLAIPGVTRAWINPNGAGTGTVVIYTMWDNAEALYLGFPQGIGGVATAETRGNPTATGDLLTVANAIFPLRPATALVFAYAPVAYPVNFSISVSGAVTSTVQAAINAAIDAVCLARADPLGGTLQRSPFEAAIEAITGMPDFTILAPAATITAPIGQLPVRGTVTIVGP